MKRNWEDIYSKPTAKRSGDVIFKMLFFCEFFNQKAPPPSPHRTKMRPMSFKRWELSQHLRCKATSPAGRGATSETVLTRTITSGDNRHCITTVDWLSVHLPHGIDLKLHVSRARGPISWCHHSARAGSELTVRCVTVKPVLRVGPWRVSWPQSDPVTAVDDGKSVGLETIVKGHN